MKPESMTHIKEIAKVATAAGSNVVAAAARGAVEPGPVQQVVEHGSVFMHDFLTGCQIAVAIVTTAYIIFKFYRLWKNTGATAKD